MHDPVVCPYARCQSRQVSAAERCGACGTGVAVCASAKCGVANNVFAGYCRGCGHSLPLAAGWPMFGAGGANLFTGVLPRSGRPSQAEVKWRRPDIGRVRAHPVTWGGLGVVGTEKGGVLGIDLTSGADVFSGELEHGTTLNSLLVARGGLPGREAAAAAWIVVGTADRVFAGDAAAALSTGELALHEVWAAGAGGSIVRELKTYGRLLVVCWMRVKQGTRTFGVDVADIAAPSRKASFPLPAPPLKPVLADRRAFIGVTSGHVWQITCDPDGACLATIDRWPASATEELDIDAPPVLKDSRLHFATASGRILRISADEPDRLALFVQTGDEAPKAFLVNSSGVAVATSLGMRFYNYTGQIEYQDDALGGHAPAVWYPVACGDWMLAVSENGDLRSYAWGGGRANRADVHGPWKGVIPRFEQAVFPPITTADGCLLLSESSGVCALNFKGGSA